MSRLAQPRWDWISDKEQEVSKEKFAMMANSAACVLLTPSLFERLSSGRAAVVMNFLPSWESSEARTIFSMFFSMVDFAFMMRCFIGSIGKIKAQLCQFYAELLGLFN